MFRKHRNILHPSSKEGAEVPAIPKALFLSSPVPIFLVLREIIHRNFILLTTLNITLYKLKPHPFFLIILLFIGCKNETELTMERGIQYYEWDMIEKAVLEFKHVIHSLDDKSNKTDYSNIKLLSRAHYNLAVAYAKKNWYEDAADEARKSFDLFPTDENHKLLELIQTKSLQKTGSKPDPINSTSR